MPLRLYDTLTRQKRPFVPLDPNNVRMYVCGPTVYDFAHIGNARPVIVFDVLFRLLRHLYGAEHVTYVRNITDVDDKINDRAARDFPGLPLNEAIRKVTEVTERQFHEDVDALGCLRPTVEPRATEHITEMRELIDRILKHKRAYVCDDHVLFRIKGLSSYGKLSHRPLEDMKSTARGEVAPKLNPMDFVLWKPSEPGEPAWKSPAGISALGRPGWHIECSAMSWKYLGERFDIHGGGIDLLFPHHENERAQSCRAFNRLKMAQFWMHNGFLQVEGEKMSKSLGNFITIRDLLANWPGDVLRLTMLKTHYRQPIDWRKDELSRSQSELRSWADLISNMALEPSYESPDYSLIDETLLDALFDDLNTPLALRRLHELGEQARRDRSKGIKFAANAAFVGFGQLHRPGFFTSVITGDVPPEKVDLFSSAHQLITSFKNYSANNLQVSASSSGADLRERGIVTEIGRLGQVIVSFSDRGSEPFEVRVRRLVSERNEARIQRNFEKSDRIRDELAAMGVALKDAKDPQGNPVTTWEIAR